MKWLGELLVGVALIVLHVRGCVAAHLKVVLHVGFSHRIRAGEGVEVPVAGLVAKHWYLMLIVVLKDNICGEERSGGEAI